MRHPQEGSRSVGVVHDEELLAVTSAISIGLIPRHTAMLSANGERVVTLSNTAKTAKAPLPLLDRYRLISQPTPYIPVSYSFLGICRLKASPENA